MCVPVVLLVCVCVCVCGVCVSYMNVEDLQRAFETTRKSTSLHSGKAALTFGEFGSKRAVRENLASKPRPVKAFRTTLCLFSARTIDLKAKPQSSSRALVVKSEMFHSKKLTI